jgi:hypothetical protein
MQFQRPKITRNFGCPGMPEEELISERRSGGSRGVASLGGPQGLSSNYEDETAFTFAAPRALARHVARFGSRR